jgi:transcriptional regulator with XRE-family HTH domain
MAANDYRGLLLQKPEFALEAMKGEFIMEVTESICTILEDEKIDRKDLAAKMNKTKGYISQLLNSDRNMTLATLAEILYALEYKPSIKFDKQNKKVIYTEKRESGKDIETEYNITHLNIKKAA